MKIKEITAGQSVTFGDEQFFDWHDRPIAAVGRAESSLYLFHALIAWNPSENFGIRLYFPISHDVAIAWICLENWDDLQ